MGLVRSLAKSVLNRVARAVGKNDLFEKPGERQHQPKLPIEEEGEEPEPARIRAADLKALQAAISEGGRPLLVHHWATWCDPCEEELPMVEELARAGVSVLGISWDRFQDFRGIDQVVASVAEYTQAKGLSWPTLVADAQPEALFEGLGLEFQKVPQSRLLGPEGVLLQVDGVLGPEQLDAIRRLSS